MKIMLNICLVTLLLNTNVLFTMDLTEASLFEKCGENHKADAQKLKDAYVKGTSSVFYKPAFESSRKNKRSKKVKDIIAHHDTDALIVRLAESKLLWVSDKQRKCLLHEAASAGYTAFCQLLLELKALPVDALYNDGSTPLHQAAVRGHAETCTLLLQHGAPINARNDALRTPAQEALLFGDTKKLDAYNNVLTVLRQHGTQLDLFDPANKCGFLFIKMMLKEEPSNFNARLRQAIFLDDQVEPQEAVVKILAKLATYVTIQMIDIKNNPGYHFLNARDTLACQVAKSLHALLAEYQRHLESKKSNSIQVSPEQELKLLRSFLSMGENKEAFSIAALLAKTADPATLETCKIVLSKNPNMAINNGQWQNALYLAARDIESMLLTQMVLHTCPSIKPALKLIWLASRRLNIVLPKAVLLHCIAPRVIINATEAQLDRIRGIVSQRFVFKNEITKLIAPDTIEQHRATISKELCATIGITMRDEPNALCASQPMKTENRTAKIAGPLGPFELYYQLP